jgi:hypothetical protein
MDELATEAGVLVRVLTDSARVGVPRGLPQGHTRANAMTVTITDVALNPVPVEIAVPREMPERSAHAPLPVIPMPIEIHNPLRALERGCCVSEEQGHLDRPRISMPRTMDRVRRKSKQAPLPAIFHTFLPKDLHRRGCTGEQGDECENVVCPLLRVTMPCEPGLVTGLTENVSREKLQTANQWGTCLDKVRKPPKLSLEHRNMPAGKHRRKLRLLIRNELLRLDLPVRVIPPEIAASHNQLTPTSPLKTIGDGLEEEIGAVKVRAHRTVPVESAQPPLGHEREHGVVVSHMRARHPSAVHTGFTGFVEIKM